MSWSINFTGKPEKFAEYMDKESERNSGNSKEELDAAKPHLVALVLENFKDASYPHGGTPLVKVKACGSGTTNRIDGQIKQVQRSCEVSIEPIYNAQL